MLIWGNGVKTGAAGQNGLDLAPAHEVDWNSGESGRGSRLAWTGLSCCSDGERRRLRVE